MNLIPVSMKIWVKEKILKTFYEEYSRNKNEFFKHLNAVYIPYKKDAKNYVIPKINSNLEKCEFDLPIPPRKLFLGYGETNEEYLKGKIHVNKMLSVLREKGFAFDQGKRILDFGCGAGRMIRWLKPFADECEIWGTDISSEHIFWARQYLRPPFNFTVNSTIPHLPFEDGYFDLIYSGSVFTHIDDFAEAWFLELRRICSKNALLYITIQDQHTILLLDTVYKEDWLSNFMNNIPEYRESKSNFDVIVGGRGPDSQVFYDINYLKKSLKTIFEIVSTEEEAYGYQTALLLKKK